MRMRSRPAVLGILLVVAVSVAVFATSSLALPGTAAPDEEVMADARPFDSLKTSGSLRVFEKRGETTYRLNFKATFTIGDDAAGAGPSLWAEPGMLPDVLIDQRILSPRVVDQVAFVGAVGFPFESAETGLRVQITGDCFTAEKATRLVLADDAAECVEAMLTVDDRGFEVGELLKSVEGRLWQVGKDGMTWKIRFDAEFSDPGYAFPITSIGEGSTTMFRLGDFGGMTEVRRVRFSG